MINIDKLHEDYFQNDLAVPYKLGCGLELNIKPVSVINFPKTRNFNVLQILKNEIGEIAIIQMSYLQFLHEVWFQTYPQEKKVFVKIMSICLGYRVEFAYHENKIVLVILDNQDIILGFAKPKEFDEIVKIILFQNLYDYNDEYVSKDVRDAITDYIRLKNKTSNSKSPTLEEKKIYVFSKKQMSMQDINNMSYRLFTQTYEMLLNCDEYLVRKIIQASEKYKVEKDPLHPLLEKKESIYDQVFQDSNSVKNKVAQANG